MLNTQKAQSKNLVLWGHSLADYCEMFALSKEDLTKRILDCGGGPASFNAEITKQGGHVISCDELYALSYHDLETEVSDHFQSMLTKMRRYEDNFVWDNIESVDELSRLRQEGIHQFLKDFQSGKEEGRYRNITMPELPFDDFNFEIALCSHYLFGHRLQKSIPFHLAAITEMARVAQEVRIFPLIDSNGELSPLVNPVMLGLQQSNMGVELKQVPYHLQKQGNAMMRVWALECSL